ncbi:unnamed protein product [Cylicostephanus goldi]|uniref:Globin family profile domain-containing protein n=1 Tax=Cylicostephanus goldi TaxID=71465 RepID=A0A3P6RGK9_CYLGO|nr:unnamed protein product [Cylicostephanus goldi]
MAEQEEVAKICEEYQKVADKYGLFERMFIQLFLEEEVELSVHFGLDNLKEDELRKDQRFRTHVGKFQRFLTGIMEMLSKGPDQAENIVQVLR